jgi:geranylgeranyl diphosphate synthase, type I
VTEHSVTATLHTPSRSSAERELIELVEAELVAFVGGETATLTTLDPLLDTLARTAGDAVLSGGKRLRPLFGYWGWRACGAREPMEAVLPALAGLELLHAFALVHDDVMDRSDFRRGRPSAHRALATSHAREGRRGDSRRFGESAAILVGDLCLVWADKLMDRALVPARNLADARRAYDRMRLEAIAGQYLDILGDSSPAWTLERALRTARLKTAAYTVARPLHFGAALAGRLDTAVSAAFTGYGMAIGEAFQLRDDLLGAFGSPGATGKPAGQDLIEGKPTVLLQLARAQATRQQLSRIEHLLHCRREEPDDVVAARLAELVAATGAADTVEEMIAERITVGRRALAGLALGEQARTALIELAETVARRPA